MAEPPTKIARREQKTQPKETPPTDASIIIQFRSANGDDTGPQLDIPHNVTPMQLEVLLNGLLNNEEKLPYSFFIEEQELLGELGAHLGIHKISVEKALSIVYQPQAVFRVRPVARCTASIPGHSEAVLSVNFSPNGSMLASGSGDTAVRFWDLGTQLPKHECKGHKNWVLVVAWSPDACYVASGDMNGVIHLWDPAEGKLMGTCSGHGKWITSMAWQPAHKALPSQRFVSGSRDNNIKVWDAVTRNCVLSMSNHTQLVTAVKWGGEGLIYSASRDCTISAWDDTDGKLVGGPGRPIGGGLGVCDGGRRGSIRRSGVVVAFMKPRRKATERVWRTRPVMKRAEGSALPLRELDVRSGEPLVFTSALGAYRNSPPGWMSGIVCWSVHICVLGWGFDLQETRG
ncbi:hypothetical protein Vafri_20907 [Volvox africanus]|uniref:NLE domain-containing protein n=1 Tax=Volvox africanus TaxID=51714 RepID=A0A8J4BUM9_9CHLO|nr:hypothetical protein Vafri_20907 [Volvox africanus]